MNRTAQTPPSSTAPSASLAALFGLVRPSFQRYRWRLLIGFLALICVDFLQLLTPRILKYGVDSLAAGTATRTSLLGLAGLILGLAILVGLLRYCWRYMIIGFSRLLEQRIRNRMFNHIVTMDAPFFERHTTGDLMAHTSNDLGAVQMACGMGLVAAVDALVMSSAAIGFMVYIHPQLTLVALLPMPFLAICTKILSSKLHRRFTTVQEQFSLLTEFSRSTMVAIRLIKAYTMENYQTDRFDQLGRTYVRSNLRVAAIQGLLFPIATLVGNLGMLLVLLYGGQLVIRTTITIGDFVAFVSYLYMMVWPMMAIGWVTSLVQRGISSLRRIHALVTSRTALPTVIDDGRPLQSAPSFVLDNLTFSYPTAGQPALRAVSYSFATGIHGITGRTGSGKSSLCRLLARLYALPDGMLFFGGEDVNRLPVDYIRRHIAYIGQEPILFSATIAANIALGRPEASQAEIEEAARHAAIHDDIVAFADGYETLIGERGVRLSGGQRQRLTLARALLCDRPVLLIDDGLSAVDVATEHQIFADLKNRLRGKTVIIVSNRIKLLSMTDRIIIFEEGDIACVGDHDSLLADNSLYRAMYEKQMRQDEVAA